MVDDDGLGRVAAILFIFSISSQAISVNVV